MTTGRNAAPPPHGGGQDPGLRPSPRNGPQGPYVGAAWRRPRRFARDPGLERLLRELSDGYGPQRWWPAETPFEVLVGAVLVQNTSWANVVRALTGLRSARLLHPAALLALDPADLEQRLRPAGTFRAKARTLGTLCAWYLEGGGLRPLQQRPLDEVRSELLGLRGIGPETADAILCYAAGRRVAILDAYARRLFERHDLGPADRNPAAQRAWLRATLAPSLLVHQEFHALVVRAGAEACKPSPRCDSCPAATPAAFRSGSLPGSRQHEGNVRDV